MNDRARVEQTHYYYSGFSLFMNSDIRMASCETFLPTANFLVPFMFLISDSQKHISQWKWNMSEFAES